MIINTLIINYNEKLITENCIRSTKQDIPIILAENGCKKEGILEDGDFTHLIFNQNYGFPAAVNVGVKACSADWVLVLNNDCVLKENFIGEMEKAAEENPEYAIFSPKILQGKSLNDGILRPGNDGAQDDVNVIYACGDKIDEKGLAGNTGRGEVDHGQYDHQKEVPLASFACILIKKELLERFPLDESYFGYYEDVDFCLRVAKAGYKIRFVPKAVCFHLGEASFGKLSNLDNEMRQFRNLSLTVIKNFPLSNIVRHWMVFNLKSFRYYFFMKRQWKFLWAEWEIIRKIVGIILP